MQLENTIARDLLTNLVFVEHTPRKSDLIFVLGNRWPGSMLVGIELYKKGLAPWMLISGGINRIAGFNEFERFKSIALEHSIPDEAILGEGTAQNTPQNFIKTKRIVEEKIGWKNVKDVILVGFAYHSWRAIRTAWAQWPEDINYSFVPVIDDRNIQADNWWKTEEGINIVLHEAEKIPKYMLQGDVLLQPRRLNIC
jgi:uncharacterized SAM-binding protein YcdF (DUF218 family)